MTDTPGAPASEAEDLANLDGLLLSCLTEALKAKKPTAATLAVAQKYLAERKAKAKPSVPPSPFAVTAPFPPSAGGTDAISGGEGRVETLRKALVMPFKADGTPEAEFRRK